MGGFASPYHSNLKLEASELDAKKVTHSKYIYFLGLTPLLHQVFPSHAEAPYMDRKQDPKLMKQSTSRLSPSGTANKCLNQRA